MSIKPKIGIVTTVADAAPHIEYFIQYHLTLGIDKVIVFVDDNCSETIRIADSFKNTIVIANNSRLHREWECYESLVSNFGNVDTEVMARQELNVHFGSQIARSNALDWVFHIDIDELIYPNGHNLHQYLKNKSIDGVGSCLLLNYEAIPTQSDHHNIYQATTHFKKNHFKRGTWHYSAKQKAFLESSDCISKLYFNYYQNGKSAYSIHDELEVCDVHAIRNKQLDTVFLTHTDPLILHFPTITFTEFCKKYEKLGVFSNSWNGQPRAGKFIDTFHLEARDAYHSSHDDFKRLYNDRVVYSQDLVDALKEIDLAVEIRAIVPNTSVVDFLETKDHNKEESSYINPPSLSYSTKTATLSQRLTKDSSFLSFPTLSEARRWLRIHPIKYTNACPVQASGQYFITVNGKRLIDLDSSTTRETISELCEANEAYVIDLSLLSLKEYKINSGTMYFNSLIQSLLQSMPGGNIRTTIFANAIPFTPCFYQKEYVNLLDNSLSQHLTLALNTNEYTDFFKHIENTQSSRKAHIVFSSASDSSTLAPRNRIIHANILLFLTHGKYNLVLDHSPDTCKALNSLKKEFIDLFSGLPKIGTLKKGKIIIFSRTLGDTTLALFCNTYWKEQIISQESLNLLPFSGVYNLCSGIAHLDKGNLALPPGAAIYTVTNSPA